MSPMSPMEVLAEETRVEMALAEHGPGVFLLAGEDGNADRIITRVRQAVRASGWPPEAVASLTRRMRSGDYNNLLRLAMLVQHPEAYDLECMKAELEERLEALRDETRPAEED